MSNTDTQVELNPEALMQMNMGYTASRCLSAGVQLGVFAHLAKGAGTAEETARGTGASLRGMAMLLDALVALQLLSKSAGNYDLTPLAKAFLVPNSPRYMGAMMENDDLWNSWTHLPEAVKTGRPFTSVDRKQNAEAFFPRLVRSLHVMNALPSKRAAPVLGAGKESRGQRVLDVACGSGIWGISFAEADLTAKLTLLDFPALLDQAADYVKRHGLEDRCTMLPGNLREVDLGENQYDIALLGNIVHSEGAAASRDLFKKLHRALSPGGRIVIIDMIPNEERTGPAFPIFFALTMLANTTEGGTYTLSEYTAWLKEAGFARVETADIQSHSPIIIGYED